MKIQRNIERGQMNVSQTTYTKRILTKFSMETTKIVRTPLAQHFKLSVANSPHESDLEHKKYMDLAPYSNVVGSIMYLMVCTIPDLSYASSLISRYMSKSGKRHREVAK